MHLIEKGVVDSHILTWNNNNFPESWRSYWGKGKDVHNVAGYLSSYFNKKKQNGALMYSLEVNTQDLKIGGTSFFWNLLTY